MNDKMLMNDAFHVIMKQMVATGQAPFYVDLAKKLGLPTEEGRQTLHALFSAGIAGWLHPGTDLVASFAPFNNLPTQYRITIDGEQKWFGQWGFESLAVSWLFPNKKVTVDFYCLDCAEPLRVEMKDGKVLNEAANAYMAYVSVPFWKWFENIAHAWGTMNLFRSKEHVRNWPHFVEGTEEGITSLPDMVKLFSGPYFSRRLDPDYVSHMRAYAMEMIEAMKEIGNTGPFWKRPKPDASWKETGKL